MQDNQTENPKIIIITLNFFTDITVTKDTKTQQHNSPVYKLQVERCDSFQ